jgi:hypothetical protein
VNLFQEEKRGKIVGILSRSAGGIASAVKKPDV